MLDPEIQKLRANFAKVDKLSQVIKFRPKKGKSPWNHSKDSLKQYDYIIIGGGAAGCVVAHRLAEDPGVNVLVLEAGYTDEVLTSRTPGLAIAKFGTHADWNLSTTAQPHAGGRSLLQPRGKILGGCSSINGMMYHRGPASDYDLWESLGNPGWSYKDVLPYFKKSERFSDPTLPKSHPKGGRTKRQAHPEFETFEEEYHGKDGAWQVSFHYLFGVSETFLKAGMSEGLPFCQDFNGSTTLGANKMQTFIRTDGVRSSLARAFLRKDAVPGGGNRGTIRVVFGADVSRIVIEIQGGKKVAKAVEFVDHEKIVRHVRARREVILCAGAFGSPQVLLASGIGPSPQPSIPHIHTLPGVGANLQDHLWLPMIFRAGDRCPTLQENQDSKKALSALLEYVFKGTGILTSNVGEGVFFLRLEDFAPEFVAREKAQGTYVERASGPLSPHLEFICKPAYARAQGTKWAPDLKNYFTISAVVLNPGSVGSVKIEAKQGDGDKRILTEPLIDPNYLADAFDVRVFAESARFVRRIVRRMVQDDADLEGLEILPGEKEAPSEDEEALQRFVRENVETIYHPVSTCKMGPSSDPMAVVDARLRVYGIDRLRVVDASAMPKIVAGHTCAPTVMLAEKACDLIKEDWQGRSAPDSIAAPTVSVATATPATPVTPTAS